MSVINYRLRGTATAPHGYATVSHDGKFPTEAGIPVIPGSQHKGKIRNEATKEIIAAIGMPNFTVYDFILLDKGGVQFLKNKGYTPLKARDIFQKNPLWNVFGAIIGKTGHPVTFASSKANKMTESRNVIRGQLSLDELYTTSDLTPEQEEEYKKFCDKSGRVALLKKEKEKIEKNKDLSDEDKKQQIAPLKKEIKDLGNEYKTLQEFEFLPSGTEFDVEYTFHRNTTDVELGLLFRAILGAYKEPWGGHISNGMGTLYADLTFEQRVSDVDNIDDGYEPLGSIEFTKNGTKVDGDRIRNCVDAWDTFKKNINPSDFLLGKDVEDRRKADSK